LDYLVLFLFFAILDKTIFLSIMREKKLPYLKILNKIIKIFKSFYGYIHWKIYFFLENKFYLFYNNRVTYA
jgi:hypothetical protein